MLIELLLFKTPVPLAFEQRLIVLLLWGVVRVVLVVAICRSPSKPKAKAAANGSAARQKAPPKPPPGATTGGVLIDDFGSDDHLVTRSAQQVHVLEQDRKP